MTEQQTRKHKQNRDTSQHHVAGAEERARKALDDRCEAVRRWIGEDDDSCCRGID